MYVAAMCFWFVCHNMLMEYIRFVCKGIYAYVRLLTGVYMLMFDKVFG